MASIPWLLVNQPSECFKNSLGISRDSFRNYTQQEKDKLSLLLPLWFRLFFSQPQFPPLEVDSHVPEPNTQVCVGWYHTPYSNTKMQGGAIDVARFIPKLGGRFLPPVNIRSRMFHGWVLMKTVGERQHVTWCNGVQTFHRGPQKPKGMAFTSGWVWIISHRPSWNVCKLQGKF